MEAFHRQEYRVRDLPTRSITLFPTRAQVSILGFTPTIDEHSISVNGTGSAVITDISVDLLENQDTFQEIYPDSDNENSGVDNDAVEPEDSSQEIFDDEIASDTWKDLNSVKKNIQALEDEVKRAGEVVASAECRLKMLDEFSKKLEPTSASEMSDIVQAYQDQRSKIFQDNMEGTLRQRQLRDQISSLQKTERKLGSQSLKERNASSEARRKEQRLERNKLAEEARRESLKYAEERRVKQERERFWARSCFSVYITLDATQSTPLSSRRSSIPSVTDLVKPTLEDSESSVDPEAAVLACDLTITYATSSAFWSPSYDLQLSTTSNTGILLFNAQLTNNTSESWKDCKIILSTSQTIFPGIRDAIPELVPWHLRLAGNSTATFDDITNSKEEVREQNKLKGVSRAGFQAIARANFIGISQRTTDSQDQVRNKFSPPVQTSLFGGAAQNTEPLPQPAITGGGFFGSSLGVVQPVAQSIFSNNSSHAFTNSSSCVEGATALLEPKPGHSLQESAMEETGFTTTYELPGTKSLVPSSITSKQRVSQISFTKVDFSHFIVAKYRPGAFLKARLQNESKTALLKGPVGLTLDGTFLRRSMLPRCSSGDSFTMSLGLDPNIKIVYPKPDVKRSVGITSGVFTKPISTSYTRTINISNTRKPSSAGDRTARLLVLDQVPVSEDERLRVEILQPRGLVVNGPGVATGVQDSDDRDGKDWGKAVATLEKGGEVKWDVELAASKSVKLGLEYNVSLPAGDHVVQAAQAVGKLQLSQ